METDAWHKQKRLLYVNTIRLKQLSLRVKKYIIDQSLYKGTNASHIYKKIEV